MRMLLYFAWPGKSRKGETSENVLAKKEIFDSLKISYFITFWGLQIQHICLFVFAIPER